MTESKKPRRRNPVATSAILRKGGAHQQSPSAERHRQRRDLERDVSDSLGKPRPAGHAAEKAGKD